MSFLLDTCVISELIAKRPNPHVVQWVEEQEPRSLYLSVITIGEIAKGICKLPDSRRKENLTTWLDQDLPNRFANRILSVDIDTMKQWGEVIANLEKQAKTLPVMDSLIAAVALRHSLGLVTRNEKDFVGTQITLINPWSLL
jgi:toxin FitB